MAVGDEKRMEQWEYEAATNEELLEEFVDTRDPGLKRELVLRYSYIVKSVAMQMRGVYASFAEVDDIINEGIIALMSALDKFDPHRNVKFNSYASLRIRGAVIDLARKQDWVPRSVRRFAKDVDEASNALYASLGRVPTEEEIAAHMNMPIEKYQKLLGKTGFFNLLSLDALIDESQFSGSVSNGVPAESNLDLLPAENFSRKELYGTLKDAVLQLRPKEQLVISLYYRKELNMKEIAKVLGVSEPRVSQIQAGALRKLRKSFELYLEEAPKSCGTVEK